MATVKTIYLIEHASIAAEIKEPNNKENWARMNIEYPSEEAAVKKITFYRQSTASQVWRIRRMDIQESIVYNVGAAT